MCFSLIWRAPLVGISYLAVGRVRWNDSCKLVFVLSYSTLACRGVCARSLRAAVSCCGLSDMLLVCGFLMDVASMRYGALLVLFTLFFKKPV